MWLPQALHHGILLRVNCILEGYTGLRLGGIKACMPQLHLPAAIFRGCPLAPVGTPKLAAKSAVISHRGETEMPKRVKYGH